MVEAVSRFRVVNGTEGAVAEAFRNRPHLVDREPGFLGMETFVDPEDAAAFYLVTRWTDEESYRAWHSSAAHRQSHQGIPKGIKLDPKFTQVRVLERLEDRSPEAVVADIVPLVASFLESSPSLIFVQLSAEGLILAHNEATGRLLGESLVGRALTDFLEPPEQVIWAQRLAAGRYGQEFLLNLRNRGGTIHTLRCDLDQQAQRVLLLGEPALDYHHWEQMQAVQHDYTMLVRQQVAAARQAVREHQQFRASHWHLARMQEHLPICMECGHIQSSPGVWCDLKKYLSDNDLWLSHGFCPDCAGQLSSRWGLE